MNVKLLELRDRNTFIPILCVDMNPGDLITALAKTANEPQPSSEVVREATGVWHRRFLLRRAGYSCDGVPTIAMARLSADGQPFWCDPYGWRDRTLNTAHVWIGEHWSELSDGDVVDVEFILGESAQPKLSEAYYELAADDSEGCQNDA